MVSSASLMDPTRIVHLEPSRGLTVSPAPELQRQLTLMRRGSLRKEIF